MTSRYSVVYRIRCQAAEVKARADAIAVEQSVEMPVEAITDASVLSNVLGRVEEIRDRGDGTFDARIAFDVETTGYEAGQLINMLFGNTSIHDDVTLEDVLLPPDLCARFTGPRYGPEGLRARAGAQGRAMTCSALKPLGLPAARFAALARDLALGGLDYIKDDHGLADQTRATFAGRVEAISKALRETAASTGKITRYLPNVSGNLDSLRLQIRIARNNGLDTLLAAPMVIGLPSYQTIVRENADMAFIAHPAMAGASRIAPAALFGRLFRMLGADGVIYPNAGGRFGYSVETCRRIVSVASAPWDGVKPALPVPAGGMKLATLGQWLPFYGHNVMLLIGGDLLSAGKGLTQQARAFQTAIETFDYSCPAESAA